MLDEAGAIVGTTCASLDITDLKWAEATLQQKNQELEQFVYSVSHDLNSPLITVKTYAGMLRQDLLTADKQQINKGLDYIDKAADKMKQLLDALLQYSRIGRIDAPVQTLSASQSVENCLSTLAGILQQHQVQVSSSELTQQLRGDSLHFEQIWQNLIENAVKYSGDQSHPQIEIGAMQQEPDDVFYVRDNGIGIEPKHNERIFNLFSQLNPGSEGSGLGLALVKKIVSIYQGRIWVESTVDGRGSCFMFTLPTAVIINETTT
ncbi:MAG: ATP-binding protein [Pelovirga sp.]